MMFTTPQPKRAAAEPQCRSICKFPVLVAALSASLLAQTTTAPQPDPFAHHDAALADATKDPIAVDHLRHVLSAQSELGTTSDDTFTVINAQTDDLGGTHVRLQQYFKGVKVVNGQVISHADARGQFGPYTNALKKRIGISTQPGLSKQAALDYLARATNPTGPQAAPPKADLVILPVMERYVIATGMPLEQPRTVTPTDVPAKTDTGGEAPADALNAAATARRVKEYRLAYEIRTAYGYDGAGATMDANQSYVDANTGEVISRQSLLHDITGHGKGKFSGNVSFATEPYGAGFYMFDKTRNFYTLDNDHALVIWDTVNVDTDNQWGDGQVFIMDQVASDANRQTAMVDGMFGATVYWDMMSNVFKRKGPDGKSYDVNVYAHYGTFVDNAFYSEGTGNVYLGDGPNRQALDVLGHENGHALVDFTAHLGGNTISSGLNESTGDIWGAMSTFYLKGGASPGAFATHATVLPNTGGSWVSVGSGRNMQKPSKGGKNQHDYWVSYLDTLDPHDAGSPNNRAFYFLAQGAGTFLKNDDSSTLLPWGMTGVGNHKAAQIWLDALKMWLPSDADYNDARQAAMLAAIGRFGAGSPEVAAVQNAYAGINVGSPAASYPAQVPVTLEVEPNNNTQSAMVIAKPMNSLNGSPNKVHIFGGGQDTDWYKVTLGSGDAVTVRLESGALTDYDLRFYDSSLNEIDFSNKGLGKVDQLTFTVPQFGPTTDLFIRVNQYSSQTPVNIYNLYVDFFNIIP